MNKRCRSLGFAKLPPMRTRPFATNLVRPGCFIHEHALAESVNIIVV
jgi:hypothetical protein